MASLCQTTLTSTKNTGHYEQGLGKFLNSPVPTLGGSLDSVVFNGKWDMFSGREIMERHDIDR